MLLPLFYLHVNCCKFDFAPYEVGAQFLLENKKIMPVMPYMMREREKESERERERKRVRERERERERERAYLSFPISA